MRAARVTSGIMGRGIGMTEGAASRPTGSRIAFSALPEDLQVLIEQFLEDADRSPPALLPTRILPVAGIPEVELDDYDRGRDHAHSMDLMATPPLVVAYGHFLDGKHRSFRARHLRWRDLVAIDLTDIMSRAMAEANSMGVVDLHATAPEPVGPIPSPYAEPDARFARDAVDELKAAFEEIDDARFASKARDAVDLACRALPGLYAELDWKVRASAPEFDDPALGVAAAIVAAGQRAAFRPTRGDLASAIAMARDVQSPAPGI